MPERAAKETPKSIRNYYRALHAAMAGVRNCRIPSDHKDNLIKLAALVEVAGGDSDVYYALLDLFGHKKRRSRWSEAIRTIPPEEEALKRIAACKRAYERIVRPDGQPVHKAYINLTQVIEVMVQIPDGEAYVREVHRGGLKRMGTIFHPNTMERAKKTLRGVFGYGKGDDYLDEALEEMDY